MCEHCVNKTVKKGKKTEDHISMTLCLQGVGPPGLEPGTP